MTNPVKIKDVTDYLETLAPLALQEPYDNCGLLTGNKEEIVKGVLVTLDCTSEVVAEAVAANCNLIVAHHPIIFKGLKKLTGSSYIEQTVISAIKNDIAIYAIHTNLDNVHTGVNAMICEKIGLLNCRILAPGKDALTKLVTFVPEKDAESVRQVLYEAGAGQIGDYKDCSFTVVGEGTFTPGDEAHPTLGKRGKPETVNEARIEMILPAHREGIVLEALKTAHPYEEAAYYLQRLVNTDQEIGAGMIGDFAEAMEPTDFLKCLKDRMELKIIRHTALPQKKIKNVAVCGGSGSFLLGRARSKGADAFISADFKYHEFFDAEGQILIADIGHYESEVFTKDLLFRVLKQKFTTFAVNFSKTNTNPVSYYTT